ncbi:MAG: BatD family protein [Verrucomicrobiales bacterium]
MTGNARFITGWKASLLVPLWLIIAGAAALAQNISARAAVSANSAFVGEGIRFQIQIEGSDKPDQPDLSGITDFSVKADGGGPRNSSSTTIINGQITRQESHGYIFSYVITPKREGALTIPPITITADGATTRTNGVRIQANKPVEVENFKLRASLSRNVAYVGEPVILEIVFYYNANVQRPNLELPALETGDFEVYDLDDEDTDQQNKIQELNGKQFHTMRLRKAVVPKEVGKVTLPPATIAFQGQSGTEIVRDFFGGRRQQPKWSRFVVPSNEETLEVRALPAAGQPKGFAGHIGEYQIRATAAPLEVNVGDPITLTVALSGPPYLEHVNLPSLHLQDALTRDFKVPEEMDDGTVNGNFKVFTQTIRATSANVSEIPPIELPYFDSDSGKYEIAKSQPIPIVVKATNVVTADDAEGLGPVQAGTSQVEAWSRGIAHNYEDMDVLKNQRFDLMQWLTAPATVAMLGGFPVLYGILLTLTNARRRREADPSKARARKALGELQRDLKGAADSNAVLEVFRNYLGSKLKVPPGALTFRDVAQPLESQGIPSETMTAIKAVFDHCEASRYAGGASADDTSALGTQVLELAQTLERRLK